MKHTAGIDQTLSRGVMNRRNWKTVALILSAAVVFVVTYALILPAITMDKETAAKQGGIDLPASQEQVDSEEAASSAKAKQTQAAGQKDDQAATETADESSARSGGQSADQTAAETADQTAARSGGQSADQAAAETADQTAAQSGAGPQEVAFQGEEFAITALCTEGTLPEDTELLAQTIDKKDADYEAYLQEARKAAAGELDGCEEADVRVAGIYDISLLSQGQAIEPDAPVDVTISYDESLELDDAKNLRIVHFAADKPEVLLTEAELKGDALQETRFTTESFSVFALVYTVDFAFNVNGNEYTFSLEGGDSTSIKEIIERFEILDEEDVESFINNIESVEFSDPTYLWNGKLTEDAFAGDLKEKNHLDIQYASNIRKGNILAMNNHHYSAPDWVLIALKPFSSEETLTVTMKTGEVFTVNVTDAQSDASRNSDGTVQTIPNPSGTTMELFNYYVSSDTKTTAGRDQWPGHIHDNNEFWKFNWYDLDGNYMCDWNEGFNRGYDKNNAYLLGYGNNIGINKNHVFKFTPANSGTVIDGTKGTKSVDGDDGGLNSWTKDADPRQGIVQETLDGGYPKLTNNSSLGTDGSSLAYLFDDTTQEGKIRSGEVDQLLYVDPDGYYTYDSRDFKAELQNDNTFKVSEQPNVDDTELKGFWPYGDEVFWVGLHMNTQFSMPVDGTVLNPKGEYKDMQFEFSGDDDTWLYIDGVLVGDGGGIHNRTEIDINFATGKVTVTGKKDSAHTGTFEEIKYLDDIFKAAGRYNDADWEDLGDGSGHKRFKAGTYHTFDMFYLERGGGESNLYIHYNLVSTEDFTGHKAYEGFADDERMTRDQFQFEMIGLDGQYQSVWNSDTQTATVTKLNDTARAIMPADGSESGAGTFEDPKKIYSSSAYIDSSGNAVGGTIFTTGVTENGDIRFGAAQIDQTEMSNCDQGHPSVYHYVVREVVPDDAVNSDGITWANATDAQKKAGGFVKDQVQYDGRIYYMAARVTSWDQTGTDGTTYKAYGLSKTYYTDDTFSEEDTTEGFIDFRNTYAPDTGSVEFTKVNGSNEPLAKATFTLYTNEACTKIAKDLNDEEQVITTGEDGKVVFDNMAAPRTYYMKETAAPSGYMTNDTVYKVTIEDSKDKTASSKIIVNGDESETEVTKIINTKPGEISAIKKWVDTSGNEVAGRDRTAKVQLKRKKSVESQNSESHTVSVQMQVWDNNAWQQGTKKQGIVYGNTVVITWDDEWQGNFNWEMTVGSDRYEGWISANNETASGSNYTIRQIGENRQLTVTNVTGDISFTVKHWQGWLHSDSNHWNNLNNPSIAGSDSSRTYVMEDDTSFPSSADMEKATQTLSPANNWAHTWSIGDGNGYDFPATDGTNPYYYYLVELTDDNTEVPIGGELQEGITLKEISYNPSKTENAGIQSGSITVVNEVASTDTISITIKKTDDAENSTNYLDGAVFKLLYRSDSEGTFTKVSNESVSELDGDGQFTVPSAGITLTGLADGQYQLQEISAPKGYVITNDYPVTFTVSDGAITGTEGTMTGVGYTAATTDSDAIFTIPNTPGAVLPNAGGAGTHLFTILGALLMALSSLALWRRRRVA